MTEIREFSIHLTEPEVHLIGEGLGSLPFKTVAVLMGKIQGQINKQVQEMGLAPEDVPPGPPPGMKPNGMFAAMSQDRAAAPPFAPEPLRKPKQ